MLRLAVLGATGRTGGRVVALASGLPDVDVVATPARAQVVPGCFAGADVVIDFSLPAGLRAALPCLDGAALVSGVTGLSPEDEALLDEAARERPVLHAANFALGVHVLADLVARAARSLPDFDVEIIEAHHGRKVDAPSGTARWLGEAAAQARGTTLDAVAVHGRQGHVGPRGREIGIHAVRAGDVVGEHTVWLAGQGERVELRHVATSRDTFALGALRAARWLVDQPPGRYEVADLLGFAP